MSMKQISESEKQIMDIIWRNERALTTAEILKQLPKNKSWKQTTVGTFLSRLTKKNIIKSTRVGRAYHYEACISEEQDRKSVVEGKRDGIEGAADIREQS